MGCSRSNFDNMSVLKNSAGHIYCARMKKTVKWRLAARIALDVSQGLRRL
jgi:hypothetical protein